MGKFTQIPIDAFQALQLDAGVILDAFDPTDIYDEDEVAEHILCATTGGITVSCTPTFSDLSEDVDNVPANMMEFMHLDRWDCTISTTSLGTSLAMLKWALGSADISGNKVSPRKSLKQTDFNDLWWVGDRADGGIVAVKIHNALSTGGMSLQTTKNGKGQTSITITGHVSINDQNTMPMEFYSIDPSSYDVEFDANGGSPIPATQTVTTVAAGGTGKATAPTGTDAPTKTGYTLDGWYTEAQFITEWDFSTDTVTKPMVLYAKWTPST